MTWSGSERMGLHKGKYVIFFASSYIAVGIRDRVVDEWDSKPYRERTAGLHTAGVQPLLLCSLAPWLLHP